MHAFRKPRKSRPFGLYLKVLAVDVLQPVVSEEPQDDLEHAFGVRAEPYVGVGAETLDKVGHHVVQTFEGF